MLAALCSTPSGIMESVTLFAQLFLFSLGMCSTPSGIMESVTRDRIAPVCEHQVLNAFRHHGIGHHGQKANMPDQPCAQRLPASWNRSLSSAGVDLAAGECSTPSGIMESVTSHLRLLRTFAIVLNAFRHHGIGHGTGARLSATCVLCSTPSGIMESVTPIGS